MLTNTTEQQLAAIKAKYIVRLEFLNWQYGEGVGQGTPTVTVGILSRELDPANAKADEYTTLMAKCIEGGERVALAQEVGTGSKAVIWRGQEPDLQPPAKLSDSELWPLCRLMIELVSSFEAEDFTLIQQLLGVCSQGIHG